MYKDCIFKGGTMTSHAEFFEDVYCTVSVCIIARHDWKKLFSPNQIKITKEQSDIANKQSFLLQRHLSTMMSAYE